VMEDKLIGIMVPGSRNKKYFLKLYQRYNDLDLTLCAFTPKDIDWKQKKVHALFYKNKTWEEKKIALPNVVYNRCYNARQNIIYRLESLIGENRCFNHKNYLSKWEVYKILKETILERHLPKTYLYDVTNLQKLLTTNSLLFLKPCYGNQGRGVYRVENLQDGEINISKDSLPPRLIFTNGENFKEDFDNLIRNKKKYIIQQGISFIQVDNRYFDLRVLVQKNINGAWEVTNIVSRVAHEDFYNTSVIDKVSSSETILKVLYSDTKVNEILNKLKFLSIKAAEELDRKIKSMAELSVDFGLDEKGKPWVIEVNGCPFKLIYNRLSNLESKKLIYRRPLEFAYFLAMLNERKI
jgi:hypothetical protein